MHNRESQWDSSLNLFLYSWLECYGNVKNNARHKQDPSFIVMLSLGIKIGFSLRVPSTADKQRAACAVSKNMQIDATREPHIRATLIHQHTSDWKELSSRRIVTTVTPPFARPFDETSAHQDMCGIPRMTKRKIIHRFLKWLLWVKCGDVSFPALIACFTHDECMWGCVFVYAGDRKCHAKSIARRLHTPNDARSTTHTQTNMHLNYKNVCHTWGVSANNINRDGIACCVCVCIVPRCSPIFVCINRDKTNYETKRTKKNMNKVSATCLANIANGKTNCTSKWV